MIKLISETRLNTTLLKVYNLNRNRDFFAIKKITYDNFINKIIIIFTFIYFKK
jgi:hypothetical protein